MIQQIKPIYQNICRYTPVTLYMSTSQMKKEFSTSLGGFFWWVIEPVFLFFVYYFVFAVVFKTKTENFVSFLLLGLIVFRWFMTTITKGSNVLNANASIMRQIDVPKIIFPIQTVILESSKFAVGLLMACAFFIFSGTFSYHTAWLLPIVLVPTFLFFLGCTLLCSAITPFFPDLKNIIQMLSRVMRYISGVFFTASQLPEKIQFYFYLNPLASILEGFRDVLLYGRMPNISALTNVSLASIGLCCIGFWMYARYNRTFPRYLI